MEALLDFLKDPPKFLDGVLIAARQAIPQPSSPNSLSFSLSLTHTDTHTQALTLSLSRARALFFSLSRSLASRLSCDFLKGPNVVRFRGGLVLKAHRLLYHPTLGLRVIKKKRPSQVPRRRPHRHPPEREMFIDNPLVRVHSIIEMSRPALRHGSLNSLFQVALYLPS